MQVKIPWSAETESGEVDFDLEVEISDYDPGRIVTHLRPEDCVYDPGSLEIDEAIRLDTGKDIWATMPEEERERLTEAVGERLREVRA